MNKVLCNKKAIVLFLTPALLLFLTMIIIPICMSAYYSLLDWNGLTKGTFVGLKNFVYLFKNPTTGFTKAIVNSLWLAVASTFVQLPIALFFALVLARGLKGERFFLSIFFIPVILSSIVIGELWLKIYNPQYGMLNGLLGALGLENLQRGWLGDKKTALICAMVPIIWQYIGYHMLLMYAAIKSVSKDIRESAMIDGANERQIAFQITIPMIKPILKTCVLFAVTGSLKAFDLIYVLTGGGPAHATEVPSTLMVNMIFDRNKYGLGSANAVFIIIECFVFALLIQKFFKTEEY